MYGAGAWSRLPSIAGSETPVTPPVIDVGDTVTLAANATMIVPLMDLSITRLIFNQGLLASTLLVSFHAGDGSIYGELGDAVSMDLRCVTGGLLVTNTGAVDLVIYSRRI